MKHYFDTPEYSVLKKEAPDYVDRVATLKKLRIILYFCMILSGLFLSLLSLILIAKKNGVSTASAISGSVVLNTQLNQFYIHSSLTWLSFGLIALGMVFFFYETRNANVF
ncbi:hypothetical protein KY339_02735 [Candidatus Woesearchaeota archaeon]|nr:hypothetical protein [Candidatus Woesearchaeota archaeon]